MVRRVEVTLSEEERAVLGPPPEKRPCAGRSALRRREPPRSRRSSSCAPIVPLLSGPHPRELRAHEPRNVGSPPVAGRWREALDSRCTNAYTLYRRLQTVGGTHGIGHPSAARYSLKRVGHEEGEPGAPGGPPLRRPARPLPVALRVIRAMPGTRPIRRPGGSSQLDGLAARQHGWWSRSASSASGSDSLRSRQPCRRQGAVASDLPPASTPSITSSSRSTVNASGIIPQGLGKVCHGSSQSQPYSISRIRP
jgi:hypothetical protein